jgi:hypothetical protein
MQSWQSYFETTRLGGASNLFFGLRLPFGAEKNKNKIIFEHILIKF